jgi:alanine racemase
VSVLTRARGPELVLDRAAVAANTRSFLARSAADLMAVVKADGYGTGAVEVARTAVAAGARRIGVTSVEEAMALRAAGIDVPVLSWLNSPLTDFGPAVAAGVELAVPSLAHLLAVPSGARVHLHLDTGMTRDGCEPAQWGLLCEEAARAERSGRVRVVGVMSHLACADTPHDPVNSLQRRRFEEGLRVAELAGLRPAVAHLAATAGALTDVRNHFDLVRVGAGLLGIDPVGGQGLQPAVTLRAPLDGVRRVPAGTPVGYGHTWRAPRDTVLGRIPLGYADGVPRTTTEPLHVGFDGRRCPVVGRVSMDQAVVDLGPLARPGMRVGETVTVFGPGDAGEPRLADWARWSGRLDAELLVGFGPRVRRTS